MDCRAYNLFMYRDRRQSEVFYYDANDISHLPRIRDKIALPSFVGITNSRHIVRQPTSREYPQSIDVDISAANDRSFS